MNTETANKVMSAQTEEKNKKMSPSTTSASKQTKARKG